MYRVAQGGSLDLLSFLRKELIYGAHLTALGGPSFLITICLLKDLPINALGLVVAYIIPFIVYSVNYHFEKEKDLLTNNEKVEYLKNRQRYYPYTLLITLLLTASILLILNSIGLILYFIIITAGGLLYTLVFKVLTRTIPGFKSLYVASLWTYHAIFFTIFLYELEIDSFFIIMIAFVFLKLLVNVIFFDIKDLESDKQENYKTFPLLLGQKKTLLILHIINSLAFVVLFYGVFINVIPAYALVLSIFYVYTMYYLFKGRKAKKADLLRYSYIMADAEFVLWPIALYIGKMLIMG